MRSWPDDLLESLREILWCQWAALGAFLSVDPARGSVVDPEALVVATCAFGRSDARLFDEAMDWISLNHGVLKPWRLKRISRTFGTDVQRTLGAVLEYISDYIGENLFQGVRDEAGDSLESGRSEPGEALFLSENIRDYEKKRSADPVFESWSLLRGTPRMRGHSGAPDLDNPANLMLRLRHYYGTATRADVMTYLLTAGSGSSNSIASKLKYNQKGVYDALEEMYRSGAVNKYGGVKSANYWVNPDEAARTFGLKGTLPAFCVWPDIYYAYFLVISDFSAHRDEYDDDFLSAERMRDLTLEVVPLLRNAYEALAQLTVPDVKRQVGNEHKNNLIQYLKKVIGELREVTCS